jgi:hypothetical protein
MNNKVNSFFLVLNVYENKLTSKLSAPSPARIVTDHCLLSTSPTSAANLK